MEEEDVKELGGRTCERSKKEHYVWTLSLRSAGVTARHRTERINTFPAFSHWSELFACEQPYQPRWVTLPTAIHPQDTAGLSWWEYIKKNIRVKVHERYTACEIHRKYYTLLENTRNILRSTEYWSGITVKKPIGCHHSSDTFKTPDKPRAEWSSGKSEPFRRSPCDIKPLHLKSAIFDNIVEYQKAPQHRLCARLIRVYDSLWKL